MGTEEEVGREVKPPARKDVLKAWYGACGSIIQAVDRALSIPLDSAAEESELPRLLAEAESWARIADALSRTPFE